MLLLQGWKCHAASVYGVPMTHIASEHFFYVLMVLRESLAQVPLYPLFHDGGGGRAPASYAEGYGIPRGARSRKRGIPRMPATPFLGLMFFNW